MSRASSPSVLGELSNVSQPGPGRRRWFADEEMDLIVWYAADGAVASFELCYDKTSDEHAFSWKRGGTAVHAAVDQGEELPSDNRSPVLERTSRPPRAGVVEDFAARAARLEPELVRLVLEALTGRPPGR